MSSSPVLDGPVPVHPEAVEGDDLALRWIIPPGILTARGAITHAPGELGDLLDAGEITSIAAAADSVLVRLAPGRTWAEWGARVRTALGEALADAGSWTGADEQVSGPDAALAEAARTVLAGPAGDYVRSHGGDISLVGVGAGCVDVRLSGACGHCPAATATLRYRVENDLRAAYPDLVEVRQVP